jgi:hypothetical protein
MNLPRCQLVDAGLCYVIDSTSAHLIAFRELKQAGIDRS